MVIILCIQMAKYVTVLSEAIRGKHGEGEERKERKRQKRESGRQGRRGRKRRTFDANYPLSLIMYIEHMHSYHL